MTRRSQIKPPRSETFQAVWPVKDESMTARELCAEARAEFFAMAAKRRLILTPSTITWEFRDAAGGGIELVYQAEAVRLDDVTSVALGKRGAA